MFLGLGSVFLEGPQGLAPPPLCNHLSSPALLPLPHVFHHPEAAVDPGYDVPLMTQLARLVETSQTLRDRADQTVQTAQLPQLLLSYTNTHTHTQTQTRSAVVAPPVIHKHSNEHGQFPDFLR